MKKTLPFPRPWALAIFLILASARPTPAALPPGCGAGFEVKQDGSKDYTLIQPALDALNHTLSTTTCVVIRDTNTYSEQITIENFTNNNYALKVMGDSSFTSSAPVVNPPALSSAAFLVRNASFTIENVSIITTNPVNWGVLSSSAQVTLRSVNIFGGANINEAGVSISSWSTVFQSSINVGVAHGLVMTGSNNTVSFSTMTDNVSGYFSLYFNAASSNTVTQSYISNPGGIASYITPNANLNTISQSAIASVSGSSALEINSSSSVISNCAISNTGGHGLVLYGAGANYNTISQSTITSGAAGYRALFINGTSSNTILNSYIQGSTAVYISGSTGTFINLTVLVATNTTGDALYLTGGSVNLTVSSSVLRGGPSGHGLFLETGNSGALSIGSVTVAGSASGLMISTQAAGFTLAVDSITFRGLAAGATAIHFLGGTFVSTITLANFEDTSVGANVVGTPLDLASRITMNAHYGARTGPAYENDPNSLVDWSEGVLSAAAFTSVSTSTLIANWTSTYPGGTTYYAQLSTGAFPNSFSGNLSSNTYNLFASFSGLSVNTSYFAQVATAAAGPFTSLSSTMTVSTSSLNAAAFSSVSTSTLIANWTSTYPGGTTYYAQLSTGAFPNSFSGNSSSNTYNLFALFSGLNVGTTYFAQVATAAAGPFTSLSSTMTVSTSSLIAAAFTSVSSSALTANWASTFPGGSTYYAQLSTGVFPNSFTGNLSSNTFNLAATFTGLSPNTTYFAQVATASAGAFTDLSSTLTFPSTPTAASPAFTFVHISSLTANWTAGGNPNPGNNLQFTTHMSSGAFPNSFSGNVIVTTVGLNSIFGAGGAGSISPNTTYYFQTAVANIISTSAFISLGSTSSLAAVPTGTAFGVVNSTSIALSWSGAGNGIGTVFTVIYSTASNPSSPSGAAVTSSATLNTSLTASGLDAATTYYFQVNAINNNSLPTAYTSAIATTTVVGSTLTAAAFTNVALSSLTINWLSTFAGGTTYYSQLSTGAFPNSYTGNASSNTFNLAATFTGLGPNTTYFAQVATAAAGPFTDLSWALTPPATALAGTPVFTAVNVASFTLAWTAGENPNPGNLTYTAQMSSGAFLNAFSGNISSTTAGLSVVFSSNSIAPNTTYYFQIRANNSAGSSTFTALGSTSSLAATPTGTAFGAIGTASIALTWSGASNGPGTIFTVLYSTAANPSSPGGATVTSSATLNTTLTASGLTSSTTYYFQVKATNNNGLSTAYTTATSTLTATVFAISAAAAPFSLVTASSLTINWFSDFPGGTTYYAQLSTGAFPNSFSGNASSDTFNLSAVFSGLSGNTSYFAQVSTVAAGSFVSLGSTLTFAAVPTGVSFGVVNSTSISLSWSGAGNSSGTIFTVLYSTAANPSSPGGAAATSSATLNTTLTASGLNGGTAYYFQVKAANNNGISTLYTSPVSTATAGSPLGAAPFSNVFSSSLTINWTSSLPGSTATYYSKLSMGAFPNSFSGNASSDTLNRFATFTGLSPNTIYFAQVAALVSTGPFASLGSTATLAMPPTGTAISSAGWTTAGVSWAANGNPAATLYELWQDGSAAFPSPVKTTTTATSASLSGLLANTTYYFKVRALNWGSVPSAFDAVVTTKTMSLDAPGTPAGTVLGISSISWNWAAAAGALTYNIYTTSAPAVLVSSGAAATSITRTGLPANTAHGLIVSAVNTFGAVSSSSTSTIVYTLAAPPTATAASNVKATSATISWLLNGNPSVTVAEIQRSTNNSSFVSVFSGSTVTFVDTSLIGCTTYYFRVRNKNLADALSSFDGPIHFITLATTPTAPGGLAADSLEGNRIYLNWTPSPTEGITQYRLYYDAGSGSINYNTPLTVLTSTQTSFTTGVLLSSVAYTFSLRASHRCGIEETQGVSAAASSIGNLASVRAGVKAPDSGKRIMGNRISVIAELSAGTPSQAQKVLFQYRTSGSGVWADITAVNQQHPNPAVDFPYLIQWDVTGLAQGAYDLRAVAFNIAGSSDTAPAAITITVASSSADIQENTDANGEVVKQQTCNDAVPNTIQTSGAEAGDPVAKIILPVGVFNGSTTVVTTISNPTITTAPPSGFTAVGSSVKIDLSNGQHNLNGTAEITLNYPNSVAFPSLLKIYSLDEATGLWTSLDSTVNTASNTITCNTPHFSIFAVIAGGAAPTQNLDTIRAYPVPWKPNGGDPNEGKPFTSGDATSGIIFDQLPVAVTIKIFTLRGRLVAKFETNAGTGAVRWDGTNLDGHDAQSGGYFAVIAAPGLRSVVKKLVIIR